MAGSQDLFIEMKSDYYAEPEAFPEDRILKEPFSQFSLWFEEACKDKSILEAHAMAVATVSSEAIPLIDMVLCEGFGKEGFKFFMNYDSPQNLDTNPNVSLIFYWPPLNRRVYIQGTAMRVPEKESDDYFQSLSRANQVNTLASQRNRCVRNREEVVKRHREIEEQYADEAIRMARPNWGGYLVTPRSVEFWQGRSDRLHDRLRYRKSRSGKKVDGEYRHWGEDGWTYERLSP